MMESAEGRHLMLQHSYQLYKQLIANEGIDCEWQERGLLFVYADHHHFESYEKTNDLLTENFGVEAKPLSGCLLYTSPSPRDATLSRMPSSA